MLRFLTRRLLLTVPVLLGVATLVFALIHLVPGDPAVSMLGEAATPADVAALRARLGLDDPLPTQYGRFLSDAVRGRLGQSLRTGRPVTTELSEKLGATVLLAVTAMIVALVVAVPLGIIAAVRADTWVDNVAMAARPGRRVDAELLARPAAGAVVRRLPGLAAHLGPWAVGRVPDRIGAARAARVSRAARAHARPRAGGDPGADDAGEPRRGTEGTVRAGGAVARTVDASDGVAPRAAERADSDHHDRRPAVRARC